MESADRLADLRHFSANLSAEELLCRLDKREWKGLSNRRNARGDVGRSFATHAGKARADRRKTKDGLTLRIHHGSRGTGTGAPRAIRATVVITLAVTSFRPILGNKHAPECKDKQTRKRKIRKQRINHHRNAAVKKKLRVQEDVYEALEVRESEKIKEGEKPHADAGVYGSVWVEPEDTRMEKSIILQQFRERYPELAEVEGPVGQVEGEDDKEARGSGGSKRNVPNPHGAEGESDGAGAGNKLPDKSKAVDIRKMAEAVFRKTGIRVRIHVLPDRDIQGRDNLRRRKGRRPGRSLKKRGWSTGMSFIRDGKLLITLKKENETMDRLEDALNKAAGDLAVKKAGSYLKMETIHVRGLDATTDMDEVVAQTAAQ
ncbi:hypothetical protein GEV33_001659 [Tenebrio molitor]|uniref:Uncharacterized protein n=1 Tax=Tenebrio molitor TaxID=7067 RepID=A0A8J6HV18_TENMO|nr:hypothetical protein GEV33_001659 [Tenebrio molitor]